MGRLEEPQAAVLAEGDPAAAELDLELRAVVRRAEEHGLAPEVHSLLAPLEHALDDELASARSSSRQVTSSGRSPPGRADQRFLGVPLARLGDDPVRRLEQRRRAAEVLREDDRPRAGIAQREVEDVAHRRGAERVDGLRVVAHDRQPAAARAQALEQIGLERVGVLVLVHQHRVEAAAHDRARGRVGEQAVEEDEQVVEVEHTLLGLAVGVGPEEQLQRVLVLLAPGEAAIQQVLERLPGVHAAAVDVRARRLAREAPVPSGEVELGAQDVQQVLRVGAVVDGEAGVEPDVLAVEAQEPRRDRVERAAPHAARGGPLLGPAVQEPVHPAQHLGRGAPGEGDQEDALRPDPAVDEMGHAVRERGGLTGPSARDDEQRLVAVRRGLALPIVERIELHGGSR